MEICYGKERQVGEHFYFHYPLGVMDVYRSKQDEFHLRKPDINILAAIRVYVCGEYGCRLELGFEWIDGLGGSPITWMSGIESDITDQLGRADQIGGGYWSEPDCSEEEFKGYMLAEAELALEYLFGGIGPSADISIEEAWEKLLPYDRFWVDIDDSDPECDDEE